MNPLILLPFILLGALFTPTVFEIFKRKDKGPKEIPEQTTYEEKPDVDTSLLERAREKARVNVSGEVMRITGDASIPGNTEINNHLVVQGKLKVGKKCHIIGSVKAFGDVEIGEASVVEGHVLSEGTIVIRRDCIIKGIVDSLKDIVIEENAVVEAVSTEKTVKIGSNAKINRRILSGSSIITSLQEAQAEVVKKPKETKISPQQQVAVEQPLVPPVVKPVLGVLAPEKPAETTGTSDQIFSHLKERIRKFDETRSNAAEEFSLEDLSPSEAKVFKIALKSSSLEEMCLRLLMDSFEVKDILDGLIKKGFLDETFKPKKTSLEEHVEPAPAETASTKEKTEPSSSDSKKRGRRKELSAVDSQKSEDPFKECK